VALSVNQIKTQPSQSYRISWWSALPSFI